MLKRKCQSPKAQLYLNATTYAEQLLTCNDVQVTILILVLFVHRVLGIKFSLKRSALNSFIFFRETNVTVSMQSGNMLRKQRDRNWTYNCLKTNKVMVRFNK